MNYMLDTNTVSHLLKGNQFVMNNLQEKPISSICISVITEAELLFGIAKRPDAIKLHKIVKSFLLRSTVLPWDTGTAKTYAYLRASMENNGLCLSALDLLIGAHALHNDAILITNDKAFKKIKEISVADWTKTSVE